MNKKVLSAILFSALFAGTGTFTSCIDNDEPAGIEELRGAKAELIRAKVAVEQAEAAYKLAQAEVEKANAAIKNAQAENQKALNEYQELLNERQSITNAEAQAVLDAKIAKAEMKAKEAQLKHQEEMIKLNEALALAQRNYDLTLAQIEIAKATMSPEAKVTIGSLQTEVSGAQDDVDAAQARVANAEDAYYIATLMVKSGEVEMKKLEAAVVGAEAELAAKKAAYDKFTNFLAEETETADWRAEVTEIEETIDSLNAELKLVELAEAKAMESEEYKALEAAVVAARKAKNEAAKDLKLEEDLSYTYKYFAGVQDAEGKVEKDMPLKDAVVLLAGAEDAPEGTYTTIGAIENEIASYTTEKQAWLEKYAEKDKTEGLAKAKSDYETWAKKWSEALAAYNASLTTAKDLSTKAAETAFENYDKAIDALDDIIVANDPDGSKTAAKKAMAELKAKQNLADALVAWYNTLPADQVAFNKVTLKLTKFKADGSTTYYYATKTVKEWLSDAENKDVYFDFLLEQFNGKYHAFYTTHKQEKLEVTVDGETVEYPTAYFAFNKFVDKAKTITDAKLADLKTASKNAFGEASFYCEGSTYLTKHPSEADAKYVGLDKAGYYGAFLAYEDKGTLWLAKNYIAVIADLEAAKEFWTAAVEEMNEALTAQAEAVEAAKEALDAAKEAVKEYEEANFTYEETETAIEIQIESLQNVKEALGEAIAYFLGVNSYDGTVEFEKWLNKKAAKALEAVYTAEEDLINAQNTLTMAQDGKLKDSVWEYMATVEAELADAMAELEAAQDELEAALANLAKGLEILAETNAK